MANIEGRNPVIEAFKGRRKINKILIQRGASGGKIKWIIDEAKKSNIYLERVDKKVLDQMAVSQVHQGVIALAESISLVSLQDMLKLAKDKKESPFIVILDQIQDPHNFGSIIRTAYASGAHGVIYQKNRAAGITPVVVKSSAGAIEHIMMAEVTNINNTIKVLKDAGLWIVGADMDGDQLYFQSDLKGPIGIVIGSEGVGLRHFVKKNCDFLIRIPMKGVLGSLNASVAAAVIIYEVVRQRG